MKKQPSEVVQHRLLWQLVAKGGEETNAVLKPDKAVREALIQSKLIEVENRKPRIMLLRLTDSGWALCNREMSWPMPKSKTKTDLFLDSMLRRLKTMFESQRVVSSLGDFINASNPSKSADSQVPSGRVLPTDQKHSTEGIEQAIRSACLELGGGRRAVRVRIADLRKRLMGFTDEDVTAALWAMSERKELTMFRLDDPQQLSTEDHQAAVHSTLGQALHIVYFGGTPS